MRSLAFGFAFVIVASFLASRPLASASVPSPVQGRTLEVGHDDVEAEHGMILRAIGRGAVQGGIERLETLKLRPAAAGIISRVDKDLARCGALRALREKHFAELIAGGKRVSLEHQGKRVVAKVIGYADGKLTLEGGKTAPSEIFADQLDLLPLVRSFSAKTLEGPDAWARGYAIVLAGDEKGVQALRGSPQADELRVDAESFYAGALRLGAAADLLAGLAARGMPTDAASARETVAGIEQLRTTYADLKLVTARGHALAPLAEAAYELVFELASLTKSLGGKLETLSDGSVRLTYDFKRAEELADFVADHDYLRDMRNGFDESNVPPRALEVKDGYLRAGGAALWRHVLEFEGPIVVTYSYGMETTKKAPVFLIGVCDDRAGSMVQCQAHGQLSARDLPTRFTNTTPLGAQRNFVPLEMITISFRVSDGMAYALENGKEKTRLECGPRNRGGLYLIVSGSNVVLFSKIVIESRLDLAAHRTRWARGKVAVLGL